jgi:ribosomal protein L11
MSQEKNPSTVIEITVSAEQAEKLYTAYCGLPTARRDAVTEAAEKIEKDQKLSHIQSIRVATFNEIFDQKLDHYFAKGLEAQKAARLQNALSLGLTVEQLDKLVASIKDQA